MRHRSVRIGLAVAAILASIAAGWYAVQTARETARLEAAARTFDHDAQDVIVETAALKAGQRAYVAPGQGEDFWTQYVARTLESIRGGLATLERTAASPDAVASLKPAETFADQLADMDARVRKGLQIGDMLAASDTIFSEGEQAAANLARQVDVARNQELARSDQLVTSDRRRQALAVGGAALAGLVVLSLLAFGDVVRRAGDRSEEPRLMLATPAEQPAAERAAADFGNLRFDGAGSAALPVSPPPGPDLEAAAAICAEIARLDSSSGLPMLLERVAALLDASGVVLWAATDGGAEGGAELRPALSHGYPPPVIAKMTAIPRDANNVTAAAYRTEQVQIATGDTVGNGAVAVPLLSPEGCAGVLTAEMRRGGESSPVLRSLASIFASQFGSVLGTAPPSASSGDVARGGGQH